MMKTTHVDISLLHKIFHFNHAQVEFASRRVVLRACALVLRQQTTRRALPGDRGAAGKDRRHLQGNRLEANRQGAGVELIPDPEVLQALQGGDGAESLPVLAAGAPGGGEGADERADPATQGTDPAQ